MASSTHSSTRPSVGDRNQTLKTKQKTTAALSLPTFDLFRLLLFAAILAYTVLFTYLAFDLHTNMRTHRSDLGQIAQAVWNSSQGRFVEMTDNGFVATRMTDHVEPLLALISPVLWLWRDVRVLLLLQVVVVALGAWPLYELTLRRLDTLLSPRERTQIWQVEPLRQLSRPLALAVAVAYLLTPQLQSALLTEFHAVPLAVPLLLWAFWAVDRGRSLPFALATVLVAATKEEMALLAAGLAVWALWRRWLAVRNPATGAHSVRTWVALPLSVLCLLWFYLATFVIVPAHATQVYATEQSVYFERYGALGDSPLDIAKSFVTQPQVVWQIATEPARRNYLWGLLMPFGLLSLLAPEILLLSLPLLLANLLSAYPAQYYGEFHYSAPLVPYVAVSAVYGLARLWRWIGRRTAQSSASYQHMAAADTAVMALVSLLTNARTALRPLITLVLVCWIGGWAIVAYVDGGRGPGGGRYDPLRDSAGRQAHYALLPTLVAQIPSEAAVTATAAVHPHVSLRRYVYQFPLGLETLGYAGAAEWALLDVTTNTDLAPGDLHDLVTQMLAGEWGVVDARDGFLLLQRGATAKAIPDAFYTFVRIPAPATKSPETQPPPTTQLVALATTDWPRWRQSKVEATWQVGTDILHQPFAPELTLVTSAGEPLQTLMSAAPPALVWYPPARWQPGELVQLTTLPLTLPRLWGVLTENPVALRNTQREQPLLRGTTPTNMLPQTLVGIFARVDEKLLQLIPTASAPPAPPLTSLAGDTARFVASPTAEDGVVLRVRGWQIPAASAPGTALPLWLRWRGTAWPAGYTVFVHVRVNGQTIAQQDGLPRLFVYPDATAVLAEQGYLDDSRYLRLPEDLAIDTEISLVVGLYEPASGKRMDIVDDHGTVIGNEWLVTTLTVAAAEPPDQACAMVPASCDAQSR